MKHDPYQLRNAMIEMEQRQLLRMSQPTKGEQNVNPKTQPPEPNPTPVPVLDLESTALFEAWAFWRVHFKDLNTEQRKRIIAYCESRLAAQRSLTLEDDDDDDDV